MFAFSLGLCWLVLTPVCVWLLFGRGHRGALRAAGALTLAALQTVTIALGFAQRPEATPARTVAVRDTGAAEPKERPPVASGGSVCDQRVATPDAVRLSFRGRALHGLTVYWPATTGQCDTATVAVHQAGHRLRIWVREGAEDGGQEGTHRVPIRVE
ncbi:hypothetical protein, partial [Microbispora triticiradicis]|uniref:hypothetical protein n=1 Tax=Microbispora triticiradicis TaxID=2200763 RepID=UPI001AD70E25